jgi:prepilin-type N-terminal cleavage/methylation domain-containing protein
MNIKSKLKRINLSSRGGYTLIELLVVIAVLGSITAVMVMTINMALMITTTDTAQSILLSQVHQGESWIAKDVASADNITTNNGTVLCSLKRYVWNQVDNITTTTTIDYVVSNTNLLRKVNGSSGTTVAQFIKYPDADTTFTVAPSAPYQSNAYLLKLKAVYGNSSYKQQFKMYQRLP